MRQAYIEIEKWLTPAERRLYGGLNLIAPVFRWASECAIALEELAYSRHDGYVLARKVNDGTRLKKFEVLAKLRCERRGLRVKHSRNPHFKMRNVRITTLNIRIAELEALL